MTCHDTRYGRAPSWRVLGLVALVGATACTAVLSDLPPKVGDDDELDASLPSDPDAELPVPAEVEDAHVMAEDASDLDAADVVEMADADERDASVADAKDDSCDSGVAWYADDDGDGFGTGEAVVACPKPSGKWAREAGDCQDADNRVFPKQPVYFGAPYRERDGNESYDYDCSGLEEGNPKQSNLGDGCGLLGITACQGSGYARTQRTGPLVNSVCGSMVLNTCEGTLAGLLVCGTTSTQATSPYLCH